MFLRPITLVGIIISIVTGISLGVLAHLKTRDAGPARATDTVIEAMRQVKASYVEEISEDELLGHAIDGIMQGLDEHSDYLDPASFHALQTHTEGRFSGVGIEIGLVEGYFTVIAPMDGTPAARAGIEAGDRITRVDDTPVKGMKLMELIERLRGAAGSDVDLTVTRTSAGEPLHFNLTRANIEIASVRSRLLEPGYGYIRISQFQNTTSADLFDAVQELASDGPLQGLVVDLRNNPGGTLQSSVEVADQFIEQGLIVYTEGRLESSYGKYRATGGDILNGAPIVVLINSGSASASEIVAGALQDHERARIIGSRSYGKGSVQSVLPLAPNQALKLTTAYYFTPNGRSIHHKGIEPDIFIDGDEELLLHRAVDVLKRDGSQTLQASLND